MQKYYNLKRSKGLTLKEGDRVYIFLTYTKQKRLSKKLNFRKKGPYLIEKVVHKDVYKLRLPLKSQSYLVFYIIQIELALLDILLIDEEVDQEGDREYEVEEILNSKEFKLGQIKYFVKQEGYKPEENTWEPIKHLTYYNARLK